MPEIEPIEEVTPEEQKDDTPKSLKTPDELALKKKMSLLNDLTEHKKLDEI